MIRLRGTVHYESGQTADFETGGAALAEWELYAMRHGFPPRAEEAPRMLMLLVIAHHALGVEEGFDVWRRSVDGIEDRSTADEELAELVPPTLPEPIAER